MRKVLSLLIIPVLLIGCAKVQEIIKPQEQNGLHEVVFHAGWDQETRTMLQEDGSAWWSPGDEISLFVGDGYNGGYKLTATNTEPAAKADFVGQIGGNSVKYTAIYPYNDSNGVCDNRLFFTIPTEQIAKEETFADGALVSVAVSLGDNLLFRNICSGIKFSVAKDNIKKIIIKTIEDWNKLSGQFSAYMNPDTGELSSISGGSSPYVVITAPGNGCFKVGSYYYVSIVPGTFSGGVTIEYYTSDNMVGTAVSEWVPTFNRAVVKRLYEKDRYLQFHPAYETTADFYPSSYPYTLLPESVDKTKITNVSFVVNSDKTTDITIPSNGAPIYFEMKGTTATYYTSAEVYNLQDGNQMFRGWTALEEADLSMFCTDRVRSMSQMFDKCKKLRNVNLSSFNTDNVRTMTSMFAGCKSLTSLDLSNFTSHSMVGQPQGAEGIFDATYNITKIDLGNFDLSVCGTNAAMAGVAKYSKNCAIRCSSASKEKLSDQESGLGMNSSADYITWVLPEEEIPNLEPIVDPNVYTSTDYSKDKTVRILHKASKGNGVDIVLLGDAYSDRMIADGTYDADMELAMNAILKDEPYSTFRDYINVYTVYAVSKNEIPAITQTVFDASIGGFVDNNSGVASICDEDEVYNYASIAFPDKDLEDIAMILIINQAEGEGNSWTDGIAGYNASWSDDEYLDYAAHAKSIGMINRRDRSQTESFSDIVAHEFGHVFAKLGDEYSHMYPGTIIDWERDFIIDSYIHVGWWRNIDVTSDPQTIKWKKFLEDSRYTGTGLGIFEGGYGYESGVWHPSANSIMSSNTGMFNAPSREAIYNRIHKLAFGKDWQYDYEAFVEYDQINIASEKATLSAPMVLRPPVPERLGKPFMKIEKSVMPDGKERVKVIMN